MEIKVPQCMILTKELLSQISRVGYTPCSPFSSIKVQLTSILSY